MSTYTRDLELLIRKYKLSESNKPTFADMERYVKLDFHRDVLNAGLSLTNYTKLLSAALEAEFKIKTKA